MNKINIISYSKVQAVIMAFAGIVAGMLYAGIGLIHDALTIGLNYGTALAFIAIPVMPLYFAVFGFLTGLIGACIYNLSLRWFCGINIYFGE